MEEERPAHLHELVRDGAPSVEQRRVRTALEATNSAVTVTPRLHRHIILRSDAGTYLAVTPEASGAETLEDSGGLQTHCIEHVDDSAVWTAVSGGYQHALSQTVVRALDDYVHTPRQDEAEPGEQRRRVRLPQLTAGADGFTAMWGPEALPSEYLATLRAVGIVAMPALLAPQSIAQLRRLAVEQVAAEDAGEPVQPLALRSALGIKVATHPVVLWVIRSYLGARFVFGHAPGFAILRPQDGSAERLCPGGWHSDYPYHPDNIPYWAPGEPGRYPPGVPFGLQCNTCITDFTPENGGTAFVLGSRDRNRRPPAGWGSLCTM